MSEISPHLLNQIHCIDLLTLCGCLPGDSVDMILCDLPYGTTACSWDVVIPFEPMWYQFKRVIKPRGAIVLTASQPFTTLLIASNLDMFKYCWVWDKSRPNGFLYAKRQPMRRHEDIAVFSNESTRYFPQMRIGKLRNKRAYSNSSVFGENIAFIDNYNNQYYPTTIIKFAKDNPTSNGHPTQKPVALFEYLIRTYTQPGEIVLDPCVGSGTTAVAAKSTGRQFVCSDTSLEYCEIARQRISTEWRQIEDKTSVFEDLPLFAAESTR